MKKSFLGCLGAFLVLLLIGSLVVNALFFARDFGTLDTKSTVVMPKHPLSASRVVEEGADGAGNIALIEVNGVIASFDAAGLGGATMVSYVKQSLEQALADDSIKGILIAINSPGGEVTASDTLYQAVKAAAEKKPVAVYMASVAASGGYYIACGAQKIVANPTTITGSIGVIMSTLKYKELMGKVGIEPITFKSGALKDTLSGSRDMSEEERAYIQALVMKMYDRFVKIVAEAREGLTEEQLRNGIADGRVFLGTEAKEVGLVDEVGYLEDAIQVAKDLASAPDAGVIAFEPNASLFDLLGFMGKAGAEPNKIEVEIKGAGLPGFQMQPGIPYYLAPSFVP